jgi:hypothetical protein
MRHARSDYDPIQDPRGLIPEDEPVFLLRGQDMTAPTVMWYWAQVAQHQGADSKIVLRVLDWAREVERYQQENGIAKVPDLPEGA